MSRSSLWVMDKDYNGIELIEYGNSWLFSPVAWDILFKKYMPSRSTPYGDPVSLLAASSFDKTVFSSLNDLVNHSPVQAERAVWEATNQQVFFTKDKAFVSNCILEFLTLYTDAKELQSEHVRSRFNEIANDISALDENIYPHFIFKNTSVDDNVESWFAKLDEFDAPLSEQTKSVTEFVIIENNKVTDFINNLDFFRGK